MDTLHAQKENVDVSGRSSGVSSKMDFRDTGMDKFATPKRGFVIHENAASGKKELKNNSTKKRRVLGDISNKQNRNVEGGSSSVASVKKTGLSLRDGQSKQLSTKKNKRKTPLKVKQALKSPLKSKTELKTPLRSKAEFKTQFKTKPVVQTPEIDDVPDIEFACGGLRSPREKSAYMAGLRDEILREILNDSTPTHFDDLEPVDAKTNWDDEKAMLESGEAPSAWWAAPDLLSLKQPEEADGKENTQEEDFGDVPPPDELPDDALDNFDDGLLDDAISVDIEATCTE